MAAWEFNTFPQDEYGNISLPSLHPACSALYNTIRRKKKSIDSPNRRSTITELFLFSCYNTLRPLSIGPGGGRTFVVYGWCFESGEWGGGQEGVGQCVPAGYFNVSSVFSKKRNQYYALNLNPIKKRIDSPNSKCRIAAVFLFHCQK